MTRAALVSIAGLLALACNTEPAQPQRPESLAALSAELDIHFPPSTRLVGVRRQQGMDDSVHVKLELAPGELPALVAETKIDDFFPGTAGMLGADKGFWNPNAAPSLRTGQAKRPDARSLNLGIDDSRPDVVVAYLTEHGS